MFRIGSGFDNHRLVPGRALWLGGVRIESDVGCEAHSDGDVLLHALTDALLGAIGAGDIGELFPDTDPQWKDQASSHFVAEALERVSQAGFRVVNVDATVFLEAVRLADYKQNIAASIRELLEPGGQLAANAVNVKAKTMEGCDAVGELRAVAAQVAVLLEGRD
jgi:2-C-methyl-D-erythritol 2,4-cyclodiphosphate synthase